ncbi:hypothetical protein [Nesterenkonia sp. Act20]|uniref:hypothetical protein n=1 Tax=Nesterenkonia sp. Act20 TaxID=1483432 RepID=UPI001C490222|nr:hypothetical protein [Nesterenkonia sp. Act20]
MDGPEVAPIPNKRVRDWIADRTTEEGGVSLFTTSSRDYNRYLELLEAWGAPSGRTRGPKSEHTPSVAVANHVDHALGMVRVASRCEVPGPESQDFHQALFGSQDHT